jgi:HK97 family phage major capsid protein
MKLLDQLVEERAEISEAQEGIVVRAADEARDLSESEDTNLKDLATRATALDERITELRDVQVANLEAAKLRAEVASTDDTEERATGRVTVTSEPLTYSERSDHSFFGDMYKAQVLSDPAAQQRMARHQSEMEVRDVGSSAFAGLVVPQYLTALAADLARAGRPTANICTQLPLPSDGLTINVSRVTTGTSAAAQATENSAVSETDIDDTLLTVNVRTYAGQSDLSRQAIERGSGIEQLVMSDLALAYSTSLNSDIINGAGTSGTHLGILNTTGIGDVDEDDASPTGAETFVQIVKAIGQVNENRYLPADIIIMHPRRWAYLAGALDGNSRPLVNPMGNNPTDPAAVGSAAGYGAVVGNVAGVNVITDAGIPTNLGAGTNEDRIIVARRSDLLLWEQGSGSPAVARFDSVGSASLTVKIVAFGYSAFTAGRYPPGVSVIQGTLLAATL